MNKPPMPHEEDLERNFGPLPDVGPAVGSPTDIEPDIVEEK